MNTFVTATNAFGRMYYRNNWTALTTAEFKAFIAIIICLGYVTFPRREVAFDKESGFGCSFIYNMMSESRFSYILRAWHYENYDEYTPEEIAANKQRDAFWPVTVFAELLSSAFEAMWNLTQGCDIDEGGIPWRGRHRYRCFNNSKPWPFHFKLFALNDAINGLFALGELVQQCLPEESYFREASASKFRRSNCIMCRRKISYRCEQCGVYLCLDAPNDRENCWKQFHTQPDIMRCQHHTVALKSPKTSF